MAFAKQSGLRRAKRLLPALAVAAAYAALPALGLGGYWLDVLTRANIFLLIALSLDLYSGTTFYLNLGVPFTVGTSAYALAVLNKYYGIPVEYGILPAVLVSVALSFAIFLPSLRVRGAYFAILSLLLPIIAAGLVTSLPLSLYLGGEGGIHYPRLLYSYAMSLPVSERLPYLRLSYFYISVAAAAIAFAVSYKVAYSDFGFMLRSIGQDELLAEASGIDTLRVKLVGFTISSFLAALAGALHAAMTPPVTAEVFVPANTLVPPLTAMILGGMGTIVGPAVANYLVLIVYEFLWGVVGRWRSVFYMSLLIVLVLLKPQGVVFYVYLRLRKAVAGMIGKIRRGA